jgi:alpha-D-ribose 1-methylphosphonate 5-triphosphate synthase subunit PhnL
VSALDEREPDSLAGRRRHPRLLGQAAPEKVGDHILQLAVLFDGADLDRAHQVIGQIERRLHAAIIPAIWFSGNDAPREWQKLALARGILRDQPLLLLLDQPTTALDAETEPALFERLPGVANSGGEPGCECIGLHGSH